MSAMQVELLSDPHYKTTQRWDVYLYSYNTYLRGDACQMRVLHLLAAHDYFATWIVMSGTVKWALYGSRSTYIKICRDSVKGDGQLGSG